MMRTQRDDCQRDLISSAELFQRAVLLDEEVVEVRSVPLKPLVVTPLG